MRWFAANLAGAGVTIENVSDQFGGMALFGPAARAALERLTLADVSNLAFPFMAARRMAVGFAPAIVARLSVTGELGYEIYVPAAHMQATWAILEGCRTEFDGRWVGMYALNSLRLEKGFGIWSREFSRDYSPHMSGLSRFIDYEKPDFIGRDAALKDKETAPSRRLVSLAIESDISDAAGYETIHCRGELAGHVTSGGYGHCVEKNLAMGYLASTVKSDSDDLTVTLLGEPCPARLLREPLIDPLGRRMRL